MSQATANQKPSTAKAEAGRPMAVGFGDLLDGIINLDSERAKALGFTSDKYDGYLWKNGDSIMVSFIVSKQRGNFRALVRRIHALGLTVKVPTPLGRMQYIVAKNGYKHTIEYCEEMDGEPVEVWVLMPSNASS
jgi:hypothetical protein